MIWSCDSALATCVCVFLCLLELHLCLCVCTTQVDLREEDVHSIVQTLVYDGRVDPVRCTTHLVVFHHSFMHGQHIACLREIASSSAYLNAHPSYMQSYIACLSMRVCSSTLRVGLSGMCGCTGVCMSVWLCMWLCVFVCVTSQIDSEDPNDDAEHYRVMLHGAPPSTAFTDIPCGLCPVMDQCTDDGVISPATCVYYNKWLEF